MPVRKLPRAVAALVVPSALLCLMGACASNSAPPHWLPKPAQATSEVYGGWIELEVLKGARRIEGELLAVSDDSVWILARGGGQVVATARVKGGKLTGYQSAAGSVATYTVLGTLSTVFNGFGLAFTAPMWILGGSIAAGSEARAAVRRVPPLRWKDLAPWARFPQGMPDGVTLESLTPKAVQEQ
jgi:hypothetical protein